jgi:hypothetical protein
LLGASNGIQDGDGDGTGYLQQGALDEKMLRLIDWNVDLLLRPLRGVVARRQALCVKSNSQTKKDHTLSTEPGATVFT